MSQSHLAACPCCARHVRVSESTCPFCRSALNEAFRATPAGQAPRGRLTRAALFALGTGVAMTPALPGCSSTSSGNEDCASDPSSQSCGFPEYGAPCVEGDTCGFATEPDGASEAAVFGGGTPDAGDASASDAADASASDSGDASASDSGDASADADADLVGVMPDAAYGVPPDAF
jgi:hypothetical protein